MKGTDPFSPTAFTHLLPSAGLSDTHMSMYVFRYLISLIPGLCRGQAAAIAHPNSFQGRYCIRWLNDGGEFCADSDDTV